MGARRYDPYINRFISPDPIIPQPGNPQSLNRYSYVYNNPLGYIDSSGHLPWKVNYVIWQAAMTIASTPAPFASQPLCHGRADVRRHRQTIRQHAKSEHALIVAASIAHQASDFKDRPYGQDWGERTQLLIMPNASVGIAQLKASEVSDWAPDLTGESLLKPEVAIRVMAAKIEASDQYILERAEAYGGITKTDRFMLLSMTQNMTSRSRVEGFVDTFFDQGKSWDKVLANDTNREQLRFVMLHIDWLRLSGWELPEGVDLDRWRRVAFEGDLWLDQ
jgi:hypothetical protein